MIIIALFQFLLVDTSVSIKVQWILPLSVIVTSSTRVKVFLLSSYLSSWIFAWKKQMSAGLLSFIYISLGSCTFVASTKCWVCLRYGLYVLFWLAMLTLVTLAGCFYISIVYIRHILKQIYIVYSSAWLLHLLENSLLDLVNNGVR